MSLFFAYTSRSHELWATENIKEQALACPLFESASHAVIWAKDQVSLQNIDLTEQCLPIALSKWPLNRDIAFQLMRIYAWQQKFEDANRLKKRWENDSDTEASELFGDLEWYQGQFINAFRYYYVAIAKSKQSSLDQWAKLIKANAAINENSFRSKVLRLAEKKSFNSPDIEKLKHPQKQFKKSAPQQHTLSDTKENDVSLIKLKGTLYFLSYQQSQEQKSSESMFGLGLKKNKAWYGSLNAYLLQRDYGEQKLYDHIFEGILGGYLFSPGPTDVSYGFGNEHHFSYESYVKIQQYLSMKNQEYSISFKRTTFPETITNHISLNGWYYLHEIIVNIGIITNTQDKKQTSGKFHLKHEASRFSPELYVIQGKGEANRAYLIHEEDTSFLACGLKANYFFKNPQLSISALMERQWEKAYNHTMLGVQLSWLP